MRVIKADHVGVVFFALEHPGRIERDARHARRASAAFAAQAKTALAAGRPASNSVRLLVFLADARANSVPHPSPRVPPPTRTIPRPCSAFAKHADQARQIELPILAAETNSRDLNGQILLAHRRSELLATDMYK